MRYALFMEPLHVLHDVVLLPPLREVDAAVLQQVGVTDVDKRQIL